MDRVRSIARNRLLGPTLPMVFFFQRGSMFRTSSRIPCCLRSYVNVSYVLDRSMPGQNHTTKPSSAGNSPLAPRRASSVVAVSSSIHPGFTTVRTLVQDTDHHVRLALVYRGDR